jgi:hypothetical protein
LVISTYIVTAAYSKSETLLQSVPDDLGQANILVCFLIFGVILCQSDFKVFMFCLVPVYTLMSVFIVRLREIKNDELIEKLPPAYRDLIAPYKLQNNMKKILIVAFPIILVLYLQ